MAWAAATHIFIYCHSSIECTCAVQGQLSSAPDPGLPWQWLIHASPGALHLPKRFICAHAARAAGGGRSCAQCHKLPFPIPVGAQGVQVRTAQAARTHAAHVHAVHSRWPHALALCRWYKEGELMTGGDHLLRNLHTNRCVQPQPLA